MRGTPMTFYKSLNRPFYILGVERALFFLILGLCSPIAFSAHFFPLMDAVSALLFIACHIVGVLITRADPQMLDIYRRHIRYKKYYAATPGTHATVPVTQPSVPIYQGKRGFV